MNGSVPGADHRAERGPVLRKGVGIPGSGWFDPRGRALGGFAFSANRVTGLGLVFYLYLHLAVLSMLLSRRGTTSSGSPRAGSSSRSTCCSSWGSCTTA